MKYKQFIERPGVDIVDNVLLNRGIQPEDLEQWKNATIDMVQSWQDLDHIQEFCAALNYALMNNQNVAFVVDPDCDGLTSSAIMINFLYSLSKKFCYEHVTYIMHQGKQHGLEDITIPDDVDLVVVMDAGTNDVECQRRLRKAGKTVIIGDHHECDNPCYDYAIIVNNQLSKKYRNKDLSGAGIAWQICRAYNDIYNTFGKVEMDMAALGLTGDMMAYNSLETRAIVSNGLKRIMNNFLEKVIQKKDYNIRHSGGVHYHSIAFYVVPYINAVIRVGTQAEKELIFKAMLDMYAHQHIQSTKRGEVGKYVDLVDEALLITDRAKRKQNQIQDEMVALAEDQIRQYNLLDHPVLVICFDSSYQYMSSMLGVIANKLQSLYSRPVFLFIQNDQELKGSARNCAKSDIEDLRGYCRESGLFSLAEGHASAFGVQMDVANLPAFLQKVDREIEVVAEPTYLVDYVWTLDTIQTKNVLHLGGHKDYWGQQVDEPLVVLRDVRIDKVRTELMSPDDKPNNTRQKKQIQVSRFPYSFSQTCLICFLQFYHSNHLSL